MLRGKEEKKVKKKMLSIFSYVSGPSVSPPCRSVQVYCPFLIGLFVLLMWSCVTSLYILKIKPLSEVSLANMFSYIVGSLFILMLFSLAVQKLFVLMRSHLVILSFMSLALGDVSVRMLLCGMSEILLVICSSRIFMVFI